MSDGPAVRAEGVSFAYGGRQALREVGFEVARGGVHAFLGPNGSGKSTLFKILATLYPMTSGRVEVLGSDLATGAAALRERMGVVFQSPALDRKLSVRENLRHAGHLYGMRGAALRARIAAVLEGTGLTDRGGDRVDTLSGGLQRRAELAKGLLHEPELLLLDEPSTGLDPGARVDLWRLLREQEGVTVLFTTHLMDEAEGADRVTILDRGAVVAAGTPAALMAEIGEEVLTITSVEAGVLAAEVESAFDRPVAVTGGTLRLQGEGIHGLVPGLVERFGSRIDRMTLSQPGLDDVFLVRTGHRFRRDGTEVGA